MSLDNGTTVWLPCVVHVLLYIRRIVRTHTRAVGEEAVLEYTRRADGSLDLYHTEVPSSQRGKGLGGVLAKVQSHDLHVPLPLLCHYNNVIIGRIGPRQGRKTNSGTDVYLPTALRDQAFRI